MSPPDHQRFLNISDSSPDLTEVLLWRRENPEFLFSCLWKLPRLILLSAANQKCCVITTDGSDPSQPVDSPAVSGGHR